MAYAATIIFLDDDVPDVSFMANTMPEVLRLCADHAEETSDVIDAIVFDQFDNVIAVDTAEEAIRKVMELTGKMSKKDVN